MLTGEICLRHRPERPDRTVFSARPAMEKTNLSGISFTLQQIFNFQLQFLSLFLTTKC